MKVVLWTLAVVAALFLVLQMALPCWYQHLRSDPKLTCQENLRQLGRTAGALDQEGLLEPLQGSAFLLQIVQGLPEGERDVLRCPADTSEGACSYLGPDGETLGLMLADGKLMQRPGEPGEGLIIACCGSNAHSGVTVLYTSGKISFLSWEELGGSGGEPVPIGPDSPNPRFRHLVR